MTPTAITFDVPLISPKTQSLDAPPHSASFPAARAYNPPCSSSVDDHIVAAKVDWTTDHQ